MFLQFPEPVLGRTRSTRKDSVRVTEFFGIGMSGHVACSLWERPGYGGQSSCPGLAYRPRATRLPEQRPQVAQHAAGLHLCKVVAPEQTCETVGVQFADRARRPLRPDVAASRSQAVLTFRLSPEIQCGDVLAPAVPMQQRQQPGGVKGVCGRKRRFELAVRAGGHRPECSPRASAHRRPRPGKHRIDRPLSLRRRRPWRG